MSRFLRLNKLRRKNDAVQIPTRPQFPIDDKLVERQIAATEKLGPNSIRPVYEDLETRLPIG
jgi:hypothetical protein